MGRRSRRSGTQTPSFDSLVNAVTLIPDTPLTDRLLSRPSVASLSPLTEIEDRRTYHPLFDDRPARTVEGTPVRPHRVTKSKYSRLPFGLQFAQPNRTLVCVRRKQRQEVLHALKRTGRGGSSRRHKRRNHYSGVQC